MDIETDRTFIYGKSTLDTRIESWWGILRKESGFFSWNALDINLVQFCLMRLLQDKLDNVMMVWNMHIIRANQTNSPAGMPLSLHLLPDMGNVEDHLECAEEMIYTCEEELFELCCLHMYENNWNLPKAFTEAIDLYLRLRN
ncbi:hypothetical protein ACJMK2_011885 [Sinanodonta woodiana]|uniref:Uncharacterized protein n=1 Tax=Sinanodonta woodiana TaxID=1069815 RepID=A0ABD3V8P6_SINWO